MKAKNKHNLIWLVLSVPVAFLFNTLVIWLCGVDIFHPVRGEGLAAWFLGSCLTSFILTVMGWKFY